MWKLLAISIIVIYQTFGCNCHSKEDIVSPSSVKRCLSTEGKLGLLLNDKQSQTSKSDAEIWLKCVFPDNFCFCDEWHVDTLHQDGLTFLYKSLLSGWKVLLELKSESGVKISPQCIDSLDSLKCLPLAESYREMETVGIYEMGPLYQCIKDAYYCDNTLSKHIAWTLMKHIVYKKLLEEDKDELELCWMMLTKPDIDYCVDGFYDILQSIIDEMPVIRPQIIRMDRDMFCLSDAVSMCSEGAVKQIKEAINIFIDVTKIGYFSINRMDGLVDFEEANKSTDPLSDNNDFDTPYNNEIYESADNNDINDFASFDNNEIFESGEQRAEFNVLPEEATNIATSGPVNETSNDAPNGKIYRNLSSLYEIFDHIRNASKASNGTAQVFNFHMKSNPQDKLSADQEFVLHLREKGNSTQRETLNDNGFCVRLNMKDKTHTETGYYKMKQDIMHVERPVKSHLVYFHRKDPQKSIPVPSKNQPKSHILAFFEKVATRIFNYIFGYANETVQGKTQKLTHGDAGCVPIADAKVSYGSEENQKVFQQDTNQTISTPYKESTHLINLDDRLNITKINIISLEPQRNSDVMLQNTVIISLRKKDDAIAEGPLPLNRNKNVKDYIRSDSIQAEIPVEALQNARNMRLKRHLLALSKQGSDAFDDDDNSEDSAPKKSSEEEPDDEPSEEETSDIDAAEEMSDFEESDIEESAVEESENETSETEAPDVEASAAKEPGLEASSDNAFGAELLPFEATNSRSSDKASAIEDGSGVMFGGSSNDIQFRKAKKLKKSNTDAPDPPPATEAPKASGKGGNGSERQGYVKPEALAEIYDIKAPGVGVLDDGNKGLLSIDAGNKSILSNVDTGRHERIPDPDKATEMADNIRNSMRKSMKREGEDEEEKGESKEKAGSSLDDIFNDNDEEDEEEDELNLFQIDVAEKSLSTKPPIAVSTTVVTVAGKGPQSNITTPPKNTTAIPPKKKASDTSEADLNKISQAVEDFVQTGVASDSTAEKLSPDVPSSGKKPAGKPSGAASSGAAAAGGAASGGDAAGADASGEELPIDPSAGGAASGEAASAGEAAPSDAAPDDSASAAGAAAPAAGSAGEGAEGAAGESTGIEGEGKSAASGAETPDVPAAGDNAASGTSAADKGAASGTAAAGKGAAPAAGKGAATGTSAAGKGAAAGTSAAGKGAATGTAAKDSAAASGTAAKGGAAASGTAAKGGGAASGTAAKGAGAASGTAAKDTGAASGTAAKGAGAASGTAAKGSGAGTGTAAKGGGAPSGKAAKGVGAASGAAKKGGAASGTAATGGGADSGTAGTGDDAASGASAADSGEDTGSAAAEEGAAAGASAADQGAAAGGSTAEDAAASGAAAADKAAASGVAIADDAAAAGIASADDASAAGLATANDAANAGAKAADKAAASGAKAAEDAAESGAKAADSAAASGASADAAGIAKGASVADEGIASGASAAGDGAASGAAAADNAAASGDAAADGGAASGSAADGAAASGAADADNAASSGSAAAADEGSAADTSDAEQGAVTSAPENLEDAATGASDASGEAASGTSDTDAASGSSAAGDSSSDKTSETGASSNETASGEAGAEEAVSEAPAADESASEASASGAAEGEAPSEDTTGEPAAADSAAATGEETPSETDSGEDSGAASSAAGESDSSGTDAANDTPSDVVASGQAVQEQATFGDPSAGKLQSPEDILMGKSLLASPAKEESIDPESPFEIPFGENPWKKISGGAPQHVQARIGQQSASGSTLGQPILFGLPRNKGYPPDAARGGSYPAPAGVVPPHQDLPDRYPSEQQLVAPYPTNLYHGGGPPYAAYANAQGGVHYRDVDRGPVPDQEFAMYSSQTLADPNDKSKESGVDREPVPDDEEEFALYSHQILLPPDDKSKGSGVDRGPEPDDEEEFAMHSHQILLPSDDKSKGSGVDREPVPDDEEEFALYSHQILLPPDDKSKESDAVSTPSPDEEVTDDYEEGEDASVLPPPEETVEDEKKAAQSDLNAEDVDDSAVIESVENETSENEETGLQNNKTREDFGDSAVNDKTSENKTDELGYHGYNLHPKIFPKPDNITGALHRRRFPYFRPRGFHPLIPRLHPVVLKRKGDTHHHHHSRPYDLKSHPTPIPSLDDQLERKKSKFSLTTPSKMDNLKLPYGDSIYRKSSYDHQNDFESDSEVEFFHGKPQINRKGDAHMKTTKKPQVKGKSDYLKGLPVPRKHPVVHRKMKETTESPPSEEFSTGSSTIPEAISTESPHSLESNHSTNPPSRSIKRRQADDDPFFSSMGGFDDDSNEAQPAAQPAAQPNDQLAAQRAAESAAQTVAQLAAQSAAQKDSQLFVQSVAEAKVQNQPQHPIQAAPRQEVIQQQPYVQKPAVAQAAAVVAQPHDYPAQPFVQKPAGQAAAVVTQPHDYPPQPFVQKPAEAQAAAVVTQPHDYPAQPFVQKPAGAQAAVITQQRDYPPQAPPSPPVIQQQAVLQKAVGAQAAAFAVPQAAPEVIQQQTVPRQPIIPQQPVFQKPVDAQAAAVVTQPSDYPPQNVVNAYASDPSPPFNMLPSGLRPAVSVYSGPGPAVGLQPNNLQPMQALAYLVPNARNDPSVEQIVVVGPPAHEGPVVITPMLPRQEEKPSVFRRPHKSFYSPISNIFSGLEGVEVIHPGSVLEGASMNRGQAEAIVERTPSMEKVDFIQPEGIVEESWMKEPGIAEIEYMEKGNRKKGMGVNTPRDNVDVKVLLVEKPSDYDGPPIKFPATDYDGPPMRFPPDPSQPPPPANIYYKYGYEPEYRSIYQEGEPAEPEYRSYYEVPEDEKFELEYRSDSEEESFDPEFRSYYPEESSDIEYRSYSDSDEPYEPQYRSRYYYEPSDAELTKYDRIRYRSEEEDDDEGLEYRSDNAEEPLEYKAETYEPFRYYPGRYNFDPFDYRSVGRRYYGGQPYFKSDDSSEQIAEKN